jgi:hypothetical protein
MESDEQSAERIDWMKICNKHMEHSKYNGIISHAQNVQLQ